ncbi:MAG: thiamine pyrophosphate-dependent enzyme [Pseudomonadales bacterium]|jgi:2-oxoisovalerate dehydrogenase E1 component
MVNRAELIHRAFAERVRSGDLPQADNITTLTASGLDQTEVIDLFETQLMSRQLDVTSRRLRARDESHYTIGSAGHEGNAIFGKVFRTTDMAFLHYRSGALLIQRSKQIPGQTPLYDMLLSFVASSEDPISGGRHKVMGSVDLMVPPQTSTIASHLPKAMGAAHAIGLAERVNKGDAVMLYDSVILCNFGDASANHSTTQGAINSAGWASYQQSPMPIVFICEDNGIGISVPTPRGWIKENFSNRAGLEYIYCDGLNLLETYIATQQAVAIARISRKPVFLHVKTVRLMGHAGSDTEISYRGIKQIEAIESQDPLLHSARILMEENILNADEIVEMHEEMEARVGRIAEVAIKRPKLLNSEDVMRSIVPPPVQPKTQQLPVQGENEVPHIRDVSEADRHRMFKGEERLLSKPQALARLINLALADILLAHPEAVVLGEDVGRKGGVYSVTTGLQNKFGPSRVLDTLLDEQTILGLAMGLAHNGFVPLPEIQFLAYVHNAEDQIRGEAATLSFFSDGQYTNPMVIRIAGLAYQKGFGGHFHNDNSFNVFRDIPGVILACPSNGQDAVQMLRTCFDLARIERRVVIFLEPIALYQTRDLFTEGDGQWCSVYPSPIDDLDSAAKDGSGRIEFGEPGVFGKGKDLCILTYGNGYFLSRKAIAQLIDKGIDARIVDLRWLAPLNETAILEQVEACASVLIVDECRKTGSLSEALMTLMLEHRVNVPVARLTAEDSFIPIGAAATLTLPSVADIVEHAIAIIEEVR